MVRVPVVWRQEEVGVPTYQYACTEPECGHQFEAVQSFSDPALTECPTCDGRLRKVFSAVGVVFKGSGFYRTDSRAAARGKADGGKTDGGKADGGNGSTPAKTTESGSPAKPSAGKSSGSGSSSGSDSKAAAS
jgi:putative FmdB family regulatory protein